MSYKLTFSLTNVTLGDLADFIEAAQELGAPDSAVLQFEGDQVIVEVGESTSSSSARSASDAENTYGTSTSGPRFSANNFGSNVEEYVSPTPERACRPGFSLGAPGTGGQP